MAKLPGRFSGRRLDGSWAGGKGSRRRSGEDKAAFDKGYDAIFGDNPSTPAPTSPPSDALREQLRRQLDNLTKEVEAAEEAVEDARDRVTQFMEMNGELL